MVDKKSIACEAGKNGNRFSETILKMDLFYRVYKKGYIPIPNIPNKNIYKKVVYSKSIYGEDGNWLGMVMDEKSIACDVGKNGNRFSETILRIDSVYRDTFPKIPSPYTQ